MARKLWSWHALCVESHCPPGLMHPTSHVERMNETFYEDCNKIVIRLLKLRLYEVQVAITEICSMMHEKRHLPASKAFNCGSIRLGNKKCGLAAVPGWTE